MMHGQKNIRYYKNIIL